MLGISAIAAGGEGYYLGAVATGIDEYYRGVGEAPGAWTGTLAAELDLLGDVAGEALAAIWAGRHPRSGEPLAAFRGRTVGGFDLCWRAPTSVSLLFAFGAPEVSAVVRDAHDAAVAAAFDYVERHAAGTRTGHAGAHTIAVDGLIAAAFRHRTSRSGDPHLHTHVLVANLARAVDGKWRTLDGRLLYHHAKTAGYLYQAHLRHELTVRLGVEWAPVEKGTADVAGIDRSVIWAFSDRRRQIVEHLDTTGFRSARAAQIATLVTRPDKHDTDPASLREVWAAKATEVGFDPATLDQVLYRRVIRPLPLAARPELAHWLVGPEGLTHHDSTFDRRSVLRAVADAAGPGAPTRDIEAYTDALLASPQVVALGPGSDPTRSMRYSTVELLELEHRLLTIAAERLHDDAGVLPPERIEQALAARPTITDEQADMVWRLCSDGAGVAVVTAPAGTGKTYALGAARDAWTAQGYQVIGAAVAAKAARELETSALIPSTTLAKLTAELDHGRTVFAANTVVVIDEAGMAGTCRIAPILAAAHTAGAKIVLVGDPRQLPAIEAGGLLNALTRTTDPITLTENRRQREPWEHRALDELRSGNVDQALTAYRDHQRIRTHDTPAEVRSAMVTDALGAHRAGEDVLMVALHRSDVTALNAQLRSHLGTDGTVHGPELVLESVPYQAGDQIMRLHNDYRLGVRNGDRATIQHVDPDQRTMRIRLTHGVRTLPAHYLDAGHTAHGYATTIHKAQGATTDRCLLLASDGLYRQAAYVALSRGRTTNHLYAVGTPDIDPDLTHAPPARQHPHDLVRDALHRDHSKDLALESTVSFGRPMTSEKERRQGLEPAKPERQLEGPSHPDDIGLGL